MVSDKWLSMNHWMNHGIAGDGKELWRSSIHPSRVTRNGRHRPRWVWGVSREEIPPPWAEKKSKMGKMFFPFCRHVPWKKNLRLCPLELSLKHSSDGPGSIDTAPESGAASLIPPDTFSVCHIPREEFFHPTLGWHQRDQSGMGERGNTGVWGFCIGHHGSCPGLGVSSVCQGRAIRAAGPGQFPSRGCGTTPGHITAPGPCRCPAPPCPFPRAAGAER